MRRNNTVGRPGASEMMAPEQAIALRPARVEEGPALSELALRSKAVWGYDPDFVERCRDELTVTREQILGYPTLVAERAGRPLGLGAVRPLPGDGGEWDVSFCFVDPAAIGEGIGRLLWDGLVRAARAAGARRLVYPSDPNAVGFYRRMGAVTVGTTASTVDPSRRLPLMHYEL
jgi:ribosomal protein S18 acetylase RimI-like enzyme